MQQHSHSRLRCPVRALSSVRCNRRRAVDSYGLRSNDQMLLSVAFARTELGKGAFVCSAPSTWSMLQKDWKIIEVISLNAIKSRLRALETTSFTCTFFYIILIANCFFLQFKLLSVCCECNCNFLLPLGQDSLEKEVFKWDFPVKIKVK